MRKINTARDGSQIAKEMSKILHKNPSKRLLRSPK